MTTAPLTQDPSTLAQPQVQAQPQAQPQAIPTQVPIMADYA
jgi:hypothetical protein